MTQKHFIAIAAIIKRQVDVQTATLNATADLRDDFAMGALMTLRDTATNMADYFASINPNFKRDRFMSACGFGD